MLSRHPILFGLLWALTVAAAFLAGRTAGPGAEDRVYSVELGPVVEANPGPEITPLPPHALLSPPDSEDLAGTGSPGAPAPAVHDAGAARAAPSGFRGSPARIFRDALENDNPLERLDALNHVVKQLNRDNIMDVVRVFADKPPDWERMRELNHVLYAWAQFDGPAAMQFTGEHLRNDQMRMQSSFQVMSAWAGRDPDAALAWARKDFEGEDNPHLVGIIKGVSRTDLDRASEIILQLPYGSHRGRAAGILIGAYLDQQGADRAMQWAGGVPDERLRDGLIRMTAAKTAAEQPRRTADWILGNARDEEVQRTLQPVVDSWSSRDPEAALAWTLDLEDTKLRSQGVSVAMNQWARRDAGAAGQWLKETAPSAERDTAIKTYAAHLLKRDPEGALAWVTEIADESERHRTLEKFAGHVIEHNPDQARKMGLLDEER